MAGAPRKPAQRGAGAGAGAAKHKAGDGQALSGVSEPPDPASPPRGELPLQELQAAQNEEAAQEKLDEISRAAEADGHIDADEQRTIGIEKVKTQRLIELLAKPRQGVQYTSMAGKDPNWIPERQAEPQDSGSHSFTTAWMGSTRRLAVSMRDWVVTVIPECCRCEETRDGAELRRGLDSICLAPLGPATHTPLNAAVQESPHWYVSGQISKYKEFLSGRTTPTAHAKKSPGQKGE
jgi:hypothetical protein